MVAELTAAMGTIKEALALAKGLKDGVHQSQLNDVAINLQQKILDLQAQLAGFHQQHLGLQEENRRIARELEIRDIWQAEKLRYEPVNLAEYLVVYQLRKEHQANEPDHYLCPDCFLKEKKAFLSKPDVNKTTFRCTSCAFECNPTKKQGPTISVVRRRSGWMHRSIDGLLIAILAANFSGGVLEGREILAGGATTGSYRLSSVLSRGAPAGAREASAVGTSPVRGRFSRPSRALPSFTLRNRVGPVVAPPANIFRASGTLEPLSFVELSSPR